MFDLTRREGFVAWREKVRAQAAKNALTLFLMAAGFVITWAVIIIANVVTN